MFKLYQQLVKYCSICDSVQELKNITRDTQTNSMSHALR